MHNKPNKKSSIKPEEAGGDNYLHSCMPENA